MEERRKRHEKRRRRRMRRGSPAGSEVEGNAEAPNNGFRETTDGSDTSSRSESAESESDDRTEAPSATEELVALGEETYDRNCASCHGESREGSYFAYPSLTDLSEHLTRKQTRDIIEKGPGSMPSFAGLSGQKKDALVTFLHEE